ncbi:MAG TPA: hypothetical protein GXZ28_03595 [Clostridiales bacterium]|nr:hypothetical protein [Clostridiales bacterium]
MKKLILCILFLLSFISITACRKKEEIVITAEDIRTNTLLAKNNGGLQVATVEDFDKTYYNYSELSEFVKKEVDTYNKKAGGDKITIDSLELREGKAILVLSFSGMDQYCNFNETSAAYFNGGAENIPIDLPTTLVRAKDGERTDTAEVLRNKKYKILVIQEPFDILVNGKVMFYSDNAQLLEENKVKSMGEDMTVIVFKP